MYFASSYSFAPVKGWLKNRRIKKGKCPTCNIRLTEVVYFYLKCPKCRMAVVVGQELVA